MMKLEVGPRSMKKCRERSSKFLRLPPHDLLVDMAVLLCKQSLTPFKEVRSLRATCREMYRASNHELVASVVIEKEKAMLLWRETRASYLAMLRYCADCGNVEAMFLFGAECVYDSRNTILGLRYLRLAMDLGHLASAYLMGVFLFRDDDTRSDAMEILNKVSTGDLSSCADDVRAVAECARSGNCVIDECHREVTGVVGKSSWRKEWEMEPRLPCQHPLCGLIAEDADCWMEFDRWERNFCGQLCRWSYEAQTFYAKI